MINAYEYTISLVVAFIVAFAFTPVAKRIAFKVGAIDVPSEERKIHKKPMARLGGLAIFAGFISAILISAVNFWLNISDIFVVDLRLLGLLAGTSIVAAVGIADDIKALSARIKLIFQIAASLIVVFSGTQIEVITNPFSEAGLTVLSDYISIPLTVFWIVGITNAINLIDGLDGLAAGVASISSLSILFIAIMNGSPVIAILTAALAGATLGFLPYNFNPAKIFMGDTGSNFLGFVLGVISIQGFKGYTAIAITIPILVLGLPIFDTLFAILRRIANGKSPMEADRGHLHHKLIDMGLSQRQSVTVMYIVSGILGLSAVVLSQSGVLRAIILITAVSIFVIIGAKYISEMVDTEKEEAADKNLQGSVEPQVNNEGSK